MKINIQPLKRTLLALLAATMTACAPLTTQELCITAETDQIAGTRDGFRYELWNQNSQGTACMTLGEGALFSGHWNGILNYLARRGLDYNQTLEHQQIGTFYADYDCTYSPSTASGNSYLSVYGWTIEPLIEYYIIEDWRNWIPSMDANAIKKGSFTVNGSEYDIYENTRIEQPSIVGNTTFKQYFSIRTNKRNSGTIHISDHFKQWESMGMNLGKLHEVSMVVEGYMSSGNFAFKALNIYADTEAGVTN
ncbi:endo-1,4-beta-xylanase [Breznakibacter xylanolyticus]|uniref:Endo-1,4-beta-xylanase n=1 Tax=Breznakibacter xylanolyticus TaxID=990 RepID=A0A2W7MZX8_9BACT|nr:glycoside hydrolase family 11 protein [Breznakibacter xylanolyticus]PZX11727.1 endo-1,4-beta-xylanase [Breznakibacter xylanolyticus]